MRSHPVSARSVPRLLSALITALALAVLVSSTGLISPNATAQSIDSGSIGPALGSAVVGSALLGSLSSGSANPEPEPEVPGAATIAASGLHTCAIRDGGAVYCWGDNYSGQLGDGTTDGSLTPVPVVGIDGVAARAVALTAGGWHTCALLDTGAVTCWGWNEDGQLGNGTTDTSLTPTPVVGIDGVAATAVALTAGDWHTCALLDTGATSCWGANGSGQLGSGTVEWSTTPTPVTGIDGVAAKAVALASGWRHACAVLDTGAATCWGDNRNGQLGDGTTDNRATPTQVTGIDGTAATAAAVSAGAHHTCAVLGTGAATCWGFNYDGQLGNGTTDTSLTSTPVSGITSGVVSLTAGDFHTCAAQDSGAVTCWGYNDDGQLGNGTTDGSLTPTPVTGITSGVVSLTAGGYHVCAILDDSAVTCWGYNVDGQLGTGDTDNRTTPTPVLFPGPA